MMGRVFLASFTALVLTVGACSDGGGDGDGSSSSSSGGSSENASYTINNFDITGTSEDNSSEQAPINPSINNGNFVMSWMLEDISDQHILSAFVSSNDVLSDSDIEFYTETCNDAVTCGQNNPYSLDCFFNNSNELFCSGDNELPTDLSNFLDTIPKSAFIIFESCDSSTLNCDTKAHAVQFQ